MQFHYLLTVSNDKMEKKKQCACIARVLERRIRRVYSADHNFQFCSSYTMNGPVLQAAKEKKMK